jgi:hypothetical protein
MSKAKFKAKAVLDVEPWAPSSSLTRMELQKERLFEDLFGMTDYGLGEKRRDRPIKLEEGKNKLIRKRGYDLRTLLYRLRRVYLNGC